MPALAAALTAVALLAGNPAAPACRPIDGLAPLLESGRVLFLGEMHGAAEPPAFTRDVVCAALAAKPNVDVELEIPVFEEARVKAFLASQGAAADVDALLQGEAFWRRPDQDGRPSVARLDLLQEIRRMRSQG